MNHTAKMSTDLKGLGAKYCPYCKTNVTHWANHVRWHHRDKINSKAQAYRKLASAAISRGKPKWKPSWEDRQRYYANWKAKHNGVHVAQVNGDIVSADELLRSLSKLTKIVAGLQASGVLQ